MIPPLDLPLFNRQLDEWHAQMAEVAPRIADPERRQQLQQAMAQMRQGQAIINEEYQKTIDDIAARTAGVHRRNTEIQARVEALQAQAAAPAADVPAPPAAPSIDPAHVMRLHDELLKRYGPHALPVAAADSGDVADIESGAFSAPPARPRKSSPPLALPTGAYAEPNIEETPEVVIETLLNLARVSARDVLYNLGCGDGRLLISAASKHGCRGVGIDSQAALVETARDNLRKARLTQLVTIDAGNPRATDISGATVVFLALGAKQIGEMRNVLMRQLRAGARIVTHHGGLADWQPDEERVVRDTQGSTYRLRLWRVPGRARTTHPRRR